MAAGFLQAGSSSRGACRSQPGPTTRGSHPAGSGSTAERSVGTGGSASVCWYLALILVTLMAVGSGASTPATQSCQPWLARGSVHAVDGCSIGGFCMYPTPSACWYVGTHTPAFTRARGRYAVDGWQNCTSLLCLLLALPLQAQARDAAMQVQAAVLTAQNIHLRRELASGWAAADSNVIQVRAAAVLGALQPANPAWFVGCVLRACLHRSLLVHAQLTSGWRPLQCACACDCCATRH